MKTIVLSVKWASLMKKKQKNNTIMRKNSLEGLAPGWDLLLNPTEI